MPEFISTSNSFLRTTRAFLGLGVVFVFGSTPFVFAIDSPESPGGAPPANGSNVDKTQKPEEDDYADTPFTEYGEFNEEEYEAAETKFFQHGRFFGVSVGVGYEGVTGGRGLLYQGGFPVLDFKLHYWFDFNLALDLGFFSAGHYFETNINNAGHVDVNIVRFGVDLKYYFDTKNVSAPISFANPYILLGVGSIAKTENYANQAVVPVPDSAFALSAGGGLEFAITPRRTFFEFEAKLHSVTFKDNFTTAYSKIGIENFSGVFYTVTGNILFTW